MKANEIIRKPQINELADPEISQDYQLDNNDNTQYAIVVNGKLPKSIKALKLWLALESVFPRTYPNIDFQSKDAPNSPQGRIIKSIQVAQTAVVKTDIQSLSTAERLADLLADAAEISPAQVQVVEQ